VIPSLGKGRKGFHRLMLRRFYNTRCINLSLPLRKSIAPLPWGGNWKRTRLITRCSKCPADDIGGKKNGGDYPLPILFN